MNRDRLPGGRDHPGFCLSLFIYPPTSFGDGFRQFMWMSQNGSKKGAILYEGLSKKGRSRARTPHRVNFTRGRRADIGGRGISHAVQPRGALRAPETGSTSPQEVNWSRASHSTRVRNNSSGLNSVECREWAGWSTGLGQGQLVLNWSSTGVVCD